jgi:hypothetical protein
MRSFQMSLVKGTKKVNSRFDFDEVRLGLEELGEGLCLVLNTPPMLTLDEWFKKVRRAVEFGNIEWRLRLGQAGFDLRYFIDKDCVNIRKVHE